MTNVVMIISHNDLVIALGDDDNLYYWNKALAVPTWSLYKI